MMSGKDGVGQIIKAFVIVATLIALPYRFRVIKTTLDDLCGLTRGAGDAVWPASFADCLTYLPPAFSRISLKIKILVHFICYDVVM
jgi:hypothetical protein